MIGNLIPNPIDLEILINSFSTTVEMNLLETGRCLCTMGYKFGKKKLHKR
jgi:hypothetical protein